MIKKQQIHLFALMSMLMMAICPQTLWAQEEGSTTTDERISKLKLVNVKASIKDQDNNPWVVTTKADYAPGLKSSCEGQNYGESTSVITLTSSKKLSLFFKYKVSSENSWDELTITISGESTFETVANAISGTSDGTYSKTLDAGTYNISMKYSKDSSANRNDDCGYIYEFTAFAPCDKHTCTTLANKCDVCGEVTEHTHAFQNSTSEVAATCAEGSKSHCTLCGELVLDGKTAVLSHSLNEKDFCSSCQKIINIEAPQNATDGFYEVSRIGHLYWIADMISTASSQQNHVAQTYKIRLTADITVNDQVLKTDGDLIDNTVNLFQWTPIDALSDFVIFDGGSHTLSGIYSPTGIDNNKYGGLFGQIGSDSYFMNLNVKDSYFQANDFVSTLMGRCYGGVHVYNVISSATVHVNYEYENVAGISMAAKDMQNCVFIGKIANSISSYGFKRDALSGYCNDGTDLKNCYYLKADHVSDAFSGGSKTNVEALDPADFTTGRIAYLLNNNTITYTVGEEEKQLATPWYQLIGTDTYPKLQGHAADIVYSDGNVYFNLEAEESFALNDGAEYTGARGVDVGTLTYKRTFSDNDFNCLYVPFSVDVNAFTDCNVYTINMFQEHDTDGDGVLDQLTLEVNKATAGKTLANHPYLIKYTGSDLGVEKEFSFTDVRLIPASVPEYKCSSMSAEYVFKGTYSDIASIADCYTLTVDNKGKTVLGPTSDGVKSQRWYMTRTSRDSQFGTAPSSAKIRTILIVSDDDEEGEATSIHNANVNENANLSGKYMEDGRIVIMKNGKKFNINGQEIK